jgi:hypothetical protein
MAEGCNEQLNFEFVEWVWNYPRRSRPKVVKLLEKHADGKQIFWLRSRGDVKWFLSQFKE